MSYHRTFYHLNRLIGIPYRKLLLICFSIFLCLFVLKIMHTKTYTAHDAQILVNYRSIYLANQEKVLVPVNINHLYDYEVICSNNMGFINRTDIIDQLIKTCNVNLHGNLTLNLKASDDFQIRSLSTATYFKQKKMVNDCIHILNETLAIIIPYRDRETNLKILLFNLIPYLERQHIFNYKIFVIEQESSGAFNKGRLYNIAFNYLMNTYRPTCVIFHDVDLIPENDFNLYSCLTTSDHPIHMSANVRSKIDGSYTTIYSFLVGGVLAMKPKMFILLNGYSNQYFNWGGEDDDMGLRLLAKSICVQRPTTGYYYALSHTTQVRNKNRFKLLFDAVLRQDFDGLNNIEELAVITHVYEYSLVTWMAAKWIDDQTSNS